MRGAPGGQQTSDENSKGSFFGKVQPTTNTHWLSCINGFVILCYLCTLCTIKCVGYFKASFSPTLKSLTIMEVVVMSHMSDLTVK